MKAMLVIGAIVAAVFMLFLFGVGEEASEVRPVASAASQPMAQQGGSLASVCSGSVLETMSSGGYTYVKVDCGGAQIWAAGQQTQVAVGDQVSLPQGQEMRDFHSATLDRTFETILFVPNIEPAGGASASQAESMAQAHPQGMGGGEQSPLDFSDLEKPAGAKSIAEIFASRTELEDQEILVLGKVVKFNAMIMGKNWMHLQDGTGEPGSNDLTVTSQGTASVGDTVLVRGNVGLNKDMGAGYRYEVLIEDATVTVQ